MTSRTTASAAGVEDLDYPVTQAGHDRLETQLAGLRSLREGELPRRMRDAQAAGDLDEQQVVREEKTAVDARIDALERLLMRARVVDPAEHDGMVVLGATVELRDESSGRTHSHVLVGMHEADEQGAMSVGSPVGRAVIGRRAGETVDVELPNGRSRQLTIFASAVGST